VLKVKAVATEGIRNAQNGDLILRELDLKIPFSIEKITGIRVAELIWKGVKASGLLTDETAMIIDIGGASTEIIIADRNEIKWLKSYKIGVSRALELLPVSEQPTQNELAALQTYFINHIPDLKSQLEKHRPEILIGTAGSFDTWRKILKTNDDKSIPYYQFNLGKLNAIINKINTTPYAERTSIKGIPEIRRESIVPAGIFVQYLLDIYNFNTVYQCNYSLAEGLIYETIKKQI